MRNKEPIYVQTWTILMVFLITIKVCSAATSKDSLSKELNSIFLNWSSSMNDQNLEKWRRTTANFRKVGIRNMIVSQKKKWPESLFESPVSPPKIDSMKMVKLMLNGPTAQLVYFGQPDFGISKEVETPEGLLFLMFVKENEGWKFGTSRFMNLNNTEEITASAKSGDFSFLDSPQFKPPGKLPKVAKLCPVPEMVGYLEIVSIGYETTVSVEERSTHRVINNVHKGLILGGLKKGINQLFIEASSIKGDSSKKPGKPHLEINVYTESKQDKKPLKKIYGTGLKKGPGKFKIIVRGDV